MYKQNHKKLSQSSNRTLLSAFLDLLDVNHTLYVGLLIIVGILPVACYAQQSNEVLRLSLDTLPRRSLELKTIYYPKIVCTWENTSDSTIVDSLLYSCRISGVSFRVMVKKDDSRIVYELSEKYNLHQKENYSFSYPVDSMKKWNTGHVSPNAIIQVPLFLIDKNIGDTGLELFLIPYFNGFSPDDRRLDNLLLSFSVMKIRRVTYKNNIIDIYSGEDVNDISVVVKDASGNGYRNSYMNGVERKDVYKIGDNILLGDSYLKLDSLDKEWQFLYLSSPDKKVKGSNLISDKFFEKVKPYFTDGHPFLLIDFWGTWCNPCIKAIPHLKELYETVSHKCNFLSICFDQPERLMQAEKIFVENNINWKNLFDDKNNPKESLTLDLNIHVFPSYILINRRKEIIFSDEGKRGLEELHKCIYQLISDD